MCSGRDPEEILEAGRDERAFQRLTAPWLGKEWILTRFAVSQMPSLERFVGSARSGLQTSVARFAVSQSPIVARFAVSAWRGLQTIVARFAVS